MAYTMPQPDQCGPSALAYASGTSLADVLTAWPGGWLRTDRGAFGAPNDTPLDNFAALEKLGIRFRVVTCEQIIRGECQDDKTVILLHRLAEPSMSWWKRLWVPMVHQHWVVLKSSTNSTITVHTGLANEPVWSFTLAKFRQVYASGWPACAYEIGVGGYRVRWWQRWVAKLTGRWI